MSLSIKREFGLRTYDEHRELFRHPPKTTLSRPQAEALWRLLPQLFRSWHPTTTTMAQHAPLVNFLSRLNTDVGAGTDKEFLTTTGRRLAAAQILPEGTGKHRGSILAMSLPNRGSQELPNRDQPRPRLTELTQAQLGPKLRSWMGGSYHTTRTAVTMSSSAPICSHFAKCSKIWAAAAARRLNGRVHTLPPIHDCGLGSN